MAIQTDIQWRGSDAEQRVARSVFDVMTGYARFFAEGATIRQSLANLERFFSSQDAIDLGTGTKNLGELIERSLKANPQVFGVEDGERGLTFVTTRAATPPAETPLSIDTAHSFRHRLFEESRQPDEDDLKAVRGIGREIPEIIVSLPEPVPAVFAVEAPEVFEPDEEAEPVEEEEAAVPAPRAPVYRVRLGEAVIDLAEDPDLVMMEHGNLFKEMLGRYLDEDFRFVQFGDEYYVEDRLERLSKGQLRDIKEYITERNEPLTDEELLSDALRRPLQNADYNLWRFTINYRLLREKKDFRFVGTRDDRLWATATLPPVGQSLRKPAELAQDYRYLSEPDLSDNDVVSPASGEEASGRLELRHVLTWYESENGVLPVGRSTQLLMPNPMLEDQTVVMLRIQDPQNFATYLAELRIGSGNRGTYIAGLDELFQSTLVPGARFSLVQGASGNEFTIEYARQPMQESRLLQWDQRRERWFFGPVVYECPVDPSYLLTEERVGELNGRKRLAEAERKKPELLLANAFELVGEQGKGGVLTALLDDLLPVVNIDRPFSRPYLESLIESAQYPQFGFEDDSVGLTYFRKP